MIPRVFLIGATGKIGAFLMDDLATDHAAGRLKVQAGVHSDRSRALVNGKGIEAVDFDLNRPDTFGATLHRVDRLFLLRPYTLRQLMHGKLIADAARRAGVGHIVTIGAYGRPTTPWSIIGWNFLVEAYIERLNLNFTHLQPNYFMDNTLAQRVAETRTLYNRILAPVSWIAASDIAAVAAQILRNPEPHQGKTYPLAAEVATVEQIAGWMSEVNGERHTVVVVEREKMMERLLAQGREPEYAMALVEYVDAVSRGEVPEIADTFDTVELICGRPAVMFRDFLADALAPARE